MWSVLLPALPTQPSANRLLLTLLSGLREVRADDDQLIVAAAVFDAFHAAPGTPP